MVHLGPLSHLEINGQDVTDLIRREEETVPVLTETPFGPREAVADWLRANDIDPDDVPIDGPITIGTVKGIRGWCIRYAALTRDEAGHIAVDPATGGPATESREASLKVGPPKNVQVKRI